MEDNKIIDLYCERHESAISETKSKFGRLCIGIAFNILANRDDAEECESDAYLSLWNSIPPTRPENLKAWISRLIRNISIDKYRKRSSQKRGNNATEVMLDELAECIPSPLNTEDEYEQGVAAKAISEFLFTLSPEQCTVFTRRYWYGDTIGSICARCFISESKAKSMLFRIRKKLKDYLEKEGIAL